MKRWFMDMEIYLPVMPVEMTYEVGDRNFLLNALPHMMLLMIRDGHSQKEVEKVTGLSSQALAQERQALLQQGLIKENGELSDTAKLALDIYEFEDNHKEEKHLYYRDMVRYLLLPLDNIEVVHNVPKNYSWIDWPDHYDEARILQNSLVAKKRVFVGYEHLLKYYDIDFPLNGAYSERKYFAPLKLDGQIKLITEAELTAYKEAKVFAEESNDVAGDEEEASESEVLLSQDIYTEQKTMDLGVSVAISGWHIHASWKFESGQEYCKDVCLLPWGDIYEYEDIVEGNDSVPRLHVPNRFNDHSMAISAFVEYMWNNDWQKNGRNERLLDLKILEPSKTMVLCSIKLEDKLL